MKAMSPAVRIVVTLCAFIVLTSCSGGQSGDSAAGLPAIAKSSILLTDGKVDGDFAPVIDNTVHAIAEQTNGDIVIAGAFTTVNSQARNGIARLKSDGSLDSTFNPNLSADADVRSIVLQTDGKIVLSGRFTSVNGQALNGIARLNPDGTLDTGFNPAADIGPGPLALQPDGKILTGGGVGPEDKYFIARLNPDGSRDTSFEEIYIPQPPLSVVLQPDGKILYQPFHLTLYRLNADGSADTSFHPSLGLGVEGELLVAVEVQPDGKILIGSMFTGVNGQPGHGIARLNPDGTLDQTFTPTLATETFVQSIALQADGRIIIGGSLCGETSCDYFLRRLYPDGTLDPSFSPSVNGSVGFIALQTDGKVLIAGGFSGFTSVDQQPRSGIARVNNTEPAVQQLSVASDGSSITWTRGGASPEVWHVEFQESSDKVNWVTLGAGTHIPGGWTLSGLSLPMHQIFYVRAIGYISEVALGSSSYEAETVRQFYLPSGTPESAIEALKSAIAGLDSSAFKNANMQQALENKLDAVLAALAAGNTNGAYNQLTHDILAKTDGCAKTGAPDNNDWIVDCQSQGEIYPLVLAAIESLHNCPRGPAVTRFR